jgi:putative ABC transport system substrate-binding protein
MWKPDEIAARLKNALQARPAAVIAPNSEIAALAKSLTSEVPIIFASHQDPIRVGLIDSLARPGKNLTGFTFFVPVDLKRLELLRQVAPHARKLGIVIDRWWLEESNGKEVALAARKEFGFDSTFFPAETLEELKVQLSSPRAREMDAWYVPYTALPYYEPGLLVRLLNALDRPVMFPATLFVEKGGLASYEPQMTLAETASLWSTMIGLVLDGVPPGEIPIERPKSFELALNVEAARRLGLAIPANLIKRADKVFDAAPTLAARKR